MCATLLHLAIFSRQPKMFQTARPSWDPKPRYGSQTWGPLCAWSAPVSSPSPGDATIAEPVGRWEDFHKQRPHSHLILTPIMGNPITRRRTSVKHVQYVTQSLKPLSEVYILEWNVSEGIMRAFVDVHLLPGVNCKLSQDRLDLGQMLIPDRGLQLGWYQLGFFYFWFIVLKSMGFWLNAW